MAKTGRRNKTKFVLHKELIILVVILIAMIVTTICLTIPSGQEKQLEEFNNAITAYNNANSTQYTLLTEENVIKKAELKNISSIIEDSKGSEEEPKYSYIVYGSFQHAEIAQYISFIDQEARRREVEVVYLYSSEKVDQQEDKEDEEFVADIENDEKLFNADVLEGVDEVDLLDAPAVFVYKNGELVFNSTTIEEDGSYSWELIINKAFSNL